MYRALDAMWVSNYSLETAAQYSLMCAYRLTNFPCTLAFMLADDAGLGNKKYKHFLAAKLGLLFLGTVFECQPHSMRTGCIYQLYCMNIQQYALLA